MEDSHSLASMPGSPGWIRPGDVMKSRKLKAKRRALEARMSSPRQILMPAVNIFSSSPRNCFSKRRNPFKCNLPNKSLKLDQEGDSSENSSDNTLFRLLNTKNSQVTSREPKFINFSEALKATNNGYSAPVDEKEKVSRIWSDTLSIDWSLKSNLRFFSSRPLPWKQTFKSIEEASGTTGFVRCLNSDYDGQVLDTSANSKFYECCLVWQHPNIPTVDVFPRIKQKLTGHTGLYGTDPKISSALLADWSDSLRSLYQLLRVRMCSYFYVCAHSFTCLFRAAGVGGVSHTHALITPTTRGFRDTMKNEGGVEFSMPLYVEEKLNKDEFKSDDENTDNEEETKLEDNEKPSSFLENLGIDSSQFPSLCQNRIKQNSKKYKGIDGTSQSLVYVEDMELQGLINFLLNCNSCVVATGALAGVPPTLLAPTAFHGGSLKSLKISGGGQVRNSKGELQHSVEVRGPILPTTVFHMNHLLSSTLEKYSLSLTPIVSTQSFNLLLPDKVGAKSNMAFASEGLVDCGLGEITREMICNFGEHDDDVQKDILPRSYKDIIYENKMYHWTDK